MSWVKRLVASRPFQRTTGVMAAEYLRLVWNTTRLVIEPEGVYERVDRDAPVIIAMWHGQHSWRLSSDARTIAPRCWSHAIATVRSMRSPRSGSASAPFAAPATTAADSSARAA